MINQINAGKRTNVITKAKQAIAEKDGEAANGRSEWGQMVGLVLSSLFTIIYMVVALGESMIGLGWSPVAAYSIGSLLGLAAIMPGEAGLWIWKTKLQSDREINGTQEAIAWIGGLAAAISAAVSTVSFFAYMLQGLMPQWYNANTAAGINVVNIAAGWAVFGISIFVYGAGSSAAKHNKARSKSLDLIREADDDMIAGIAAGRRTQTDKLLEMMDQKGLFMADALHEVSDAMGLGGGRIDEIIAEYAKDQQEETAAPPAPLTKQPIYSKRQGRRQSTQRVPNGEEAGEYNPGPFE